MEWDSSPPRDALWERENTSHPKVAMTPFERARTPTGMDWMTKKCAKGHLWREEEHLRGKSLMDHTGSSLQ